ncbi:MAG: DUF1461 domain-containing protein [Clostridia bacterium]|nr:DUF1461 domain-containing protein [Clostridia bacterium]
MNGRSILMGAGMALILIAVILSAFLNAIHAEALRPELYDADSRVAVAAMLGVDPVRDAEAVTAYIGMKEEEQRRFAETVTAYMRGKSETLPPQLNEKEQVHFGDVRQLIQLAGRVSSILLGLAALLTVFGAWLAEHPGTKTGRALAIGAALGLAVLVGSGLWVATHFETAFIGMHRLIFPNNLWLMNPETDICIRMMPTELFQGAAVRCLIRTAWQSALIAALLGILTIFMRRLIKKWVNAPIPG